MAFHVPEDYRITMGELGTTAADGNNGAFVVRSPDLKSVLVVLASDGMGWEHVSVSVQHQRRTPTWDEMQHIKQMFWGAEDCVVQYHPPESEYVDCHPGCLHLWRPVGVDIVRPPSILVGPVRRAA